MLTIFFNLYQNYSNVSCPRILIFCLILFFLNACSNRPEKLELLWKEIDTPTTDRLEGVYFLNDSVGHLVGGIPYQHGIYLATYDGGQTWESASFANTIYDFTSLDNGAAVLTGLSGMQRKVNREEAWFIQGFPTINFEVPPFNAVDRGVNGQLLIGGGIAFKNGLTMRLSEDFQLVALDSFPAEISDVTYINQTRAIAVGYGIVIVSEDGGTSWERLPVYNDFFKSVHFPTAETGYMVGFSGSILKSEDGGLSWSTQRDGNRLTVSDEPFRSVFFADESRGFIVGDSGLFWMTTDGGDNWKSITNLPDRNFYDIFILNEKIYIVGDQGSFIQLEIPR